MISKPVLVGRDREVGTLVAALECVPAGNGSLYLISGEPGIGKSQLAMEATRRARECGVAPVWGRCWEAGGAPAFWPWREVCDALSVAFPAPAAMTALGPVEARFALFREVQSVLARAAADKPLLVVLEDLHAADRSTLLVLEFVAGQLQSLPVMVIGTFRDLEARLRDEVADSIARLGRLGRLLQPARLDAREVGVLVRDGIVGADDQLVATVFDATQGNPLFVDEIVRDIRVHGQRSGLPLGVREVIRHRLLPLSPETRAVLEVVAVLGVEVAAADVIRMVPDAARMLGEATYSGVLVPRGERLRFAHALYREALYFDLPHARRQMLHRDAARALAGAGASLAELAHHLLEAGPDASPDAIEYAIRAAVHATDTFAYEDAIALLERARATVPPGADATALRCRLMIALGETRIRSGDAGGGALCVDAAETARALGDAALLAQAALAYGTVFLMGGVDPVLVAMLEQALELLPTADSSLRARAMARLAAARQPSPPAERDRDVELGLASIAMARRVASPRDLLGVLHAASGVLYNHSDPAVRQQVSHEQERLAEQLGDTTRLLQARARLAIDHLEQGDFSSYAQLAASYEVLAASIGPAAAPWRVPLMRSTIALSTDRFDESERWQLEARRIDADQPRARRAEAFHRIGFLRAAERHAELRAAIPELRGLWLAMPYGMVLADAHVASSLARIGADAELRELVARLPDAAIDEEINASVLADAAWCTGDPAFAARLEPVLAPFVDRWQSYWFDCEIADAPTTRGLAYLAAILGRWDDCERLFTRALDTVVGLGRRSLAARMRFELGDLFVRKHHELGHARELLAVARDEAHALDLGELVALIDRRHPNTSTAAPATTQAPSFAMLREGEYYTVPTTRGTLRFKVSRGMHYLALLTERPHVEVHVLELVGSSERADRGDAGDLTDAAALRAYRARLGTLRDAVEDAEAIGDSERAERARDEMEAIAAELARTTQKGGRARRTDSSVDRARSAVQRRLKDAIERIAEQDRELGTWLRRVVRTGNYCSFRPLD